MDWTQVLTVMATMLGGVYAFYQITKQEIAVIREQITLMGAYHREDMKCMDEKIKCMDEKWERLFEKLLLKEQK